MHAYGVMDFIWGGLLADHSTAYATAGVMRTPPCSGTFSDTAIANPAWTAPTATASDQAIGLTLTVTDDASAG